MITSNNTLLLARLEKVPATDKLNIFSAKRPAKLRLNKFTSNNKTNVIAKSDNLLLSRENTSDSSLLYYKRLEKMPGSSKPIYSQDINKVTHREIPDNTDNIPTLNVDYTNKDILINHEFTHFSTSLEFKKRDSNLPNFSSLNISRTLTPRITPLACTSGSNHFRTTTSSLLSKQCKQTNTFSWVKYDIPLPPPNLEQVERKLYPHRFKIILKEISFCRIPSPPPHMPEAIRFPLPELIPSPPPDIPSYLMSEIIPQTIKIRTDRIPNPILSIIPSPPPDIPSYLISEIIPQTIKIRTDHIPNPILSIIPSPPPDIPSYLISEIIPQTIKIRTDRIPNPILSIIPSPPPDIPSYLMSEIIPQTIKIRTDRIPNPILSIIPLPPPDIPSYLMSEIIPQTIKIRTDRIPNPILSIIPSPPPDIPSYLMSEIIPQTIKIRTDRIPNPILSIIPLPPPNIQDYKSSDILPQVLKEDLISYPVLSIIPHPPANLPKEVSILPPPLNLHDDFLIPLSPTNLPNVSQIPSTPSLDSSESSGSWDSTLSPTDSDFHAIHLQEIVNVANLRENERISKSQKPVRGDNRNTKPVDFHAIHLQEIVNVANLREIERISKSQKPVRGNNRNTKPVDFHAIHLQEIVNVANLREIERISKSQKAVRGDNRNTKPVDFHAIHLQEIVNVANLREIERISKSQKAVRGDNRNTKPVDFHAIHLQEIVNVANLRENERISKSQKAVRGDNRNTKPVDFHAIHLQEIVNVANLREIERISKSRKAVRGDNRNTKPVDFHAIHLQEIVNAANLREIERISKSQKAVRGDNRNTKPVDFHAIHLQEIVNVANLREKATKKSKNILKKTKKNKKNASLDSLQETFRNDAKNLPGTQHTRLSISLPCLKQKSYFLKLISALGLTHINTDIFLHKHTKSSIKFTIDEILNLLTEVENNLLMDKPIRGILPQSIWNICASSYPDLTQHYNHMSRHLTPEMYNRLLKLKTASGFTIDEAIQTGVDNPGDPFNITIGCVAGDEDSYSIFAELFDPVIYSANNGYTLDRIHFSDFDPFSITDGYFDPNYVLSCQVLAARSIKGFPMLPHCTRAERRGVENVVKECITNMPHPFKGSYFPLSSVTQDNHGYLSSRNFLFSKPVSPLIIAARMNRGWPDARGMWLNRDENFMAWVNTEDHVRLISMQEGGDFKSVFERFCLGVQMFEMTISLRGHAIMKNNHLGYILTCPSNLGTGMIITITMTSPKLLSYPGFEIILEFLRLEKKGKIDTKTGEFQVCNRDRLGFTEVELAQKLIHGVQLLIRIEKTLWSGLNLIEFLQEVRPDLANLLLVGVYPKDSYNRIMIPKFIPPPPPDILD